MPYGDTMFHGDTFAANFDLDDSEDGGFDTVLSQEKADPAHPLHGNHHGLPLDVAMSVLMTYNGATKTVSMLITEAATGNVLVDNVTTTPDLDITAPICAPWANLTGVTEFSVDLLSLMNYQDGWVSYPFGAPTLIATVEYNNAWFAESNPVPEPGTGSAVAVVTLGLLVLRRRRS